MTSFNDYWKKKAAKRKKSWAAKNERFANEHITIEEIRDKVFMPIDYDKRGFDADAFITTYSKRRTHLLCGIKVSSVFQNQPCGKQWKQKELMCKVSRWR